MATLVDGRMTPAEEERAWTHVHGCPPCSEAVQREGWVKRRLAGLSFAGTEPVPAELHGTLRDPAVFAAYPAGPPDGSDWALDAVGPVDGLGGRRRLAGLAVLGAGSVSAAMMGVVALGVSPANAPGLERRAPASISQPLPAAGTTVRARLGRLDSDLSSLDPGTAARQVASTVGAGMRMGL